jgi:hypothetical protein
MAQRSEIFYVFDVGSGLRAYSFEEARLITLNYIKRSRYFIAYRHAVGTKAVEAAGEEAIPSRMFEGAAGGAVMLGSAPRCPEFHELFDWPDALIEIPSDSNDVRAILAELDRNPKRLDRARHLNTTQSMRRHDWVYRWEHVLNTLGFEAPQKVKARKAQLEALAAETDRWFDSEEGRSGQVAGSLHS